MSGKQIIEYAAPATASKYQSDAFRLTIVFTAALVGSSWVAVWIEALFPTQIDFRLSPVVMMPLALIPCVVFGVVIFFTVKIRERLARARLFARSPIMLVILASLLIATQLMTERAHPIGLNDREAMIDDLAIFAYLVLVGCVAVTRKEPPRVLQD